MQAREPRPGTVEHYEAHFQCHQRIANLTKALNEIAEIAATHADDPVNMQIHGIARGVLPR